MKLKTIKSSKETGLPNVEFIYVEKNITEVVIGKLRIRKGESYSPGLQVLVETPFEEAKRFRLVGKLEGFPDAVSYHEYKHEAENAASDFKMKGAEAVVTEVAVLLDDDGEVVSVEGEGESAAVDDDISF